MSYGNEMIRVSRLENGLEVEIYEPAPRKKSQDKKDSCCPSVTYNDPWKAYAFESDESALEFIAEKLPGLRRKSDKDEFNDTFDEVTK